MDTAIDYRFTILIYTVCNENKQPVCSDAQLAGNERGISGAEMSGNYRGEAIDGRMC